MQYVMRYITLLISHAFYINFDIHYCLNVYKIFGCSEIKQYSLLRNPCSFVKWHIFINSKEN